MKLSRESMEMLLTPCQVNVASTLPVGSYDGIKIYTDGNESWVCMDQITLN